MLRSAKDKRNTVMSTAKLSSFLDIINLLTVLQPGVIHMLMPSLIQAFPTHILV